LCHGQVKSGRGEEGDLPTKAHELLQVQAGQVAGAERADKAQYKCRTHAVGILDQTLVWQIKCISFRQQPLWQMLQQDFKKANEIYDSLQALNGQTGNAFPRLNLL